MTSPLINSRLHVGGNLVVEKFPPVSFGLDDRKKLFEGPWQLG